MNPIAATVLVRMTSFLGWGLISCLCRSVRLTTVGYENVRELMEADKGFIMAVWHGRTMLPVHYCRGMGIWAITSLSRDGEIQTRIVTRFGYQTIRGSSAKGGIRAALTAGKKLQEGGVLSITPDGPTGPPNEVQDGVIFLAQRTGCPIVPLGVGAREGRRMGTWDSYLVPRPFSRCAIVFGKPIYLTETESAGDGAEPKLVIKRAIDECQMAAQNMVGDVH